MIAEPNELRYKLITILQGRHDYFYNRNPSKLEKETLAYFRVNIDTTNAYLYRPGLLEYCHLYSFEPAELIHKIHNSRSEYLDTLVHNIHSMYLDLHDHLDTNHLNTAAEIAANIRWTHAQIGCKLLPERILLEQIDPREYLLSVAVDTGQYYTQLKDRSLETSRSD